MGRFLRSSAVRRVLEAAMLVAVVWNAVQGEWVDVALFAVLFVALAISERESVSGSRRHRREGPPPEPR